MSWVSFGGVRVPLLEVIRREEAHEAVLELDNVAMGDTLEDGNLRLEVLQ
jgi:hypothetical protein